jgi:hypothetical protein
MAAHSSSKNRMLVATLVDSSWTRWRNAPRSGSAVSVAKFRKAKVPAFSTFSWMAWSSSTVSASPVASSSAILPCSRDRRPSEFCRAATRSFSSS